MTALPPTPSTSGNDDSAMIGSSRSSVLLLEDEAMIGADLRNMLESAGHAVCGPLASVEEALAEIDRTRFDAAILDVKLRGQPAFAVMAALATRRIPFVIVTGYGAASLPEPFRKRPLIVKPFSRCVVLDNLAAVLAAAASRTAA